MKVGKVEVTRARQLTWSFSVSFRNTPENLHAAHMLMKRDDLKVTIKANE